MNFISLRKRNFEFQMMTNICSNQDKSTVNKFAVIHGHGTDPAEELEAPLMIWIADCRVRIYLKCVVIAEMRVVTIFS